MFQMTWNLVTKLSLSVWILTFENQNCFKQQTSVSGSLLIFCWVNVPNNVCPNLWKASHSLYVKMYFSATKDFLLCFKKQIWKETILLSKSTKCCVSQFIEKPHSDPPVSLVGITSRYWWVERLIGPQWRSSNSTVCQCVGVKRQVR